MPTLTTNNIQPFPLYCMFKGEWGTRKSTQALSFPQPQYWFDFDRKMEGLYLPMRAWGIEQVDFDSYEDWSKAELKLKSFQTSCKYKTLIVDTLTSLGDNTNLQTKRTKSKDSEGKKIAGISVNSIEDFNAESSVFQDLIALTKDIHRFHKVNIVLIAHIMITTEKVGTQTHISRSIVTGGKKISAKLPGYCHEIYHFNMKDEMIGEKKYSCLTTHTVDDFARTALPLPKEIVFEDKPLYSNWILPAMQKLAASSPKSIL